MFVRAAIAGQVFEDRLLVPREAILTRDGRPVVFKVEDDRAQWVYVKLGERNDHLVEIARIDQGGPLDPGTLVVVDNHLTLDPRRQDQGQEEARDPDDPWTRESPSRADAPRGPPAPHRGQHAVRGAGADRRPELPALAVDLLPSITYPRLTVLTVYEDIPAEDLERLVTQRLEEVVTALSGVRGVRSRTREGISIITVEYEWGTQMDFANLHLREAVDRVAFRDDFPEAAERPVILRWDPTSRPISILVARGSGTGWRH